MIARTWSPVGLGIAWGRGLLGGGVRPHIPRARWPRRFVAEPGSGYVALRPGHFLYSEAEMIGSKQICTGKGNRHGYQAPCSSSGDRLRLH